MNSPERWQQIEDLFQAALERPLSERPAFLADAWSTEPGLYDEVAAHEQKAVLIDSPPADWRGLARSSPLHLPSRFGQGA